MTIVFCFNGYLINNNSLPVRINGERLALAALPGLDLADDNRAHVSELVDDGHHEGAFEVTLKRRQGIDVWNEGVVISEKLIHIFLSLD